MSFQINCSAFPYGQPIPAKFTCSGANIIPPLSWTGIPPRTKSFALIVDDPDAPAGIWVHWVLFNIPGEVDHLPENKGPLTGLGISGTNDYRRQEYNGPCPPPGKVHRYFFKLYALDCFFDLQSRTTKSQLEQAMQTHILAQAAYMGTFQR